MEATPSHDDFMPFDRLLHRVIKHLPLWITPLGITFFRMALIVPIVALLIQQWWIPALALYLVAGLTDAFDGALARFRGQVSEFGARIDPLADKLLHGAIFLVFFSSNPFLILAVIVLDVFLLFAAIAALFLPQTLNRAHSVHARAFGKWKFFAQMCVVMLFMLRNIGVDASWIVSLGNSVLVVAIVLGFFSLLQHSHQFFSATSRR